MMAQSPIKTGSKRTHKIHANMYSLNSDNPISNRSNETLEFSQSKKASKSHNNSTSMTNPANVGNVHINNSK